MTKLRWKNYVKKKIQNYVQRQSNEKKEKTKLRHQKGQKFEMQEYLQEKTITRAGDLLRAKLELLNFGSDTQAVTSGLKPSMYKKVEITMFCHLPNNSCHSNGLL